MTRNGRPRTLQDRRLAKLSNSKRTAKARARNQNTTFSTESAEPGNPAAAGDSLAHRQAEFPWPTRKRHLSFPAAAVGTPHERCRRGSSPLMQAVYGVREP